MASSKTVSSLRVRITGDNSGLNTSLQTSSKNVRAFAMNVRQSSQQMKAFQSSGLNSRMMIQQLGYAAEDAAVSWGTGGLSGALRGSAGNLAMVAGAINPVLGAVTGLGLALGASLIPMLTKSKSEIDENAKAVDRWAESFRNLDKWADWRKFIEVGRPRLQADLLGESPESLRKGIEERRDLLRELDVEMRAARGKRAGVLMAAGMPEDVARSVPDATAARPNPAKEIFDRFMRDNPGTSFNLDMTQLREIEQRMVDIGGERLMAARELRDHEAQLSKAEFRENQELWEKSQEAAAKARDELRSLATDILGDLDPKEAQREQVRQTLDSRIAEINDLLPGIGNAGLRFALSESARRAAAQQLEPERRIEDRLAGGHAFGTVEAISALNRAAAGGTKDSHETAKNTKEAVAELKTIANQVKRIGKADSLVAGPSIP